MKRDPALRDLSSDHQQALVQARHLVQAAERTGSGESQAMGGSRVVGGGAVSAASEPVKVARSFLAFWADHTIRHFREEEEVLLPAFARYGDPWEPPVVRMLVEHVQIRRLVSDMAHQLATGLGTPSPGTMHALGSLLHSHIRHEEDVLFPLIESIVPPDALLELPEAFSTFS